MPAPDTLKGRVAMVYGAGAPAGGISNGLAAAVAYAQAGARVFAIDRDEAALRQTVAVAQERGFTCETLCADVADEAAVARATETVLERAGTIDILHNNVGISDHGTILDIDRARFSRILDANLIGAYNTIRAALPAMIASGRGSIVNISSIGSRVHYPGMVTYQVSKAALESLTMAVALDFAAKGVRCNAIVAGYIDTPLVRSKTAAKFGGEAAMVEALSKLSPTGKMGTPWDLAESAVFLCSDAANYINGVHLTVDGGAEWRA